MRWEIDGVEVELVVVGKHALHNELRHVVDQVIEEQGQKEREALLEQCGKAVELPSL